MIPDYRLSPGIPIHKLFDGRLGRFGIHERPDGHGKGTRHLEKDPYHQWVLCPDEGDVHYLVSERECGSKQILDAIVDAFGVRLISQCDPEFWGFESSREWNDWIAEMKKPATEFKSDVLRFLLKEPSSILRGTVRYRLAMKAREVVSCTPNLLEPGNRSQLMNTLDEILFYCDLYGHF